MSVSDDRWTCPSCGRTVVVSGSEADVRCCIAAAQLRHASGHKRGEEVLHRLGLPDPVPLHQPATLPRARKRRRPC